MGLRAFMPMVIACPGCGRTTSTYFQQLARDIQATCASRCRCGANSIPASREMDVAVMGCVVNGPGESKHANIGISLPGPASIRRRRSTSMAGRPSRSGRQHRRRVSGDCR